MNKRSVQTLTVYSFTHMVVDALCISGVLSLGLLNNLNEEFIITLIVLYNVIAFGSQSIIGYFCDIIKRPKLFALLGGSLSILALAFMKIPILAMLLFGIGNGFFHIGGGVRSLYLTPGRALAPGIFVAPGAIGVFIASYVSDSFLPMMMVALILLISLIGIMITKEIEDEEFVKEEPLVTNKFLIVIACLLMVICLRALVGGALYFPWRTTMTTKIFLLSAIVLGKGLGGVLGDKFGFEVVGVGGLLLSALCLYFGESNLMLALIGVFAFNLTMPITLTTLANTFVKYKGFAFGLTTLALASGYMINRSYAYIYERNVVFIVSFILISATALYFGLRKKSVL